jgi:hypothetical protein
VPTLVKRLQSVPLVAASTQAVKLWQRRSAAQSGQQSAWAAMLALRMTWEGLW